MKKTLPLSTFIVTLFLCAVCVSCSKDEKLANRLSGGWEGDWGMSYVDRDGIQHDAYNTVIEFYPNEKFDTQGYGYQEDYYDAKTGPLTKLGYYFEWRIDKQKIFITYPKYGQSYVIRDYVMKKDHFTGYIGDTHFDLDKVWKYYKWYDYAALYASNTLAVLCWIGDEYYYYDDYFTRGGGAAKADAVTLPDGTTIQPISEDKCPVRIFNRFAEGE